LDEKIREKTRGRISYHDSVEEMLKRIREDKLSNVFDRYELQEKIRCKFCLDGVSCQLCSDGPCRISEKGGQDKGVCGIGADAMAMRTFLLHNIMGAGTYSHHAYEAFRTLKATAQGKNSFKITDNAKLKWMCQMVGLDTNKADNDLAVDLADFLESEMSKGPDNSSVELGSSDNYEKAIHYIANAENQFYSDLARGVRYASGIYGGYDYGMQIAGNEMPGYHTGYGALMGAAVGARHSHLCNGGYSFDQSKPFEKDNLVEYLFNEEIERCLLNSLIICLFARKVYNRENIIKVLDCLGKTYTNDDLDKIARRILRTKLRIKQKLGFDLDKVKIPKRFYETPSMTGQLKEEMTAQIMADFKHKCDELLASED
jgi:aldehyde:ferredoxin oxidoreductase